MIPILEHFRQSNLIEGVDDPKEDQASMDAFEVFVKNGINESSILTVHWLVMHNQMNNAGHWRTVGVQIGGRVCPHPTMVPTLMTHWLEDWSELTPRVAHISFERIHPFRDGNGRVGRMLMWHHEMKNGQEPTLIHFDDRWSYYDWF